MSSYFGLNLTEEMKEDEEAKKKDKQMKELKRLVIDATRAKCIALFAVVEKNPEDEESATALEVQYNQLNQWVNVAKFYSVTKEARMCEIRLMILKKQNELGKYLALVNSSLEDKADSKRYNKFFGLKMALLGNEDRFGNMFSHVRRAMTEQKYEEFPSSYRLF